MGEGDKQPGSDPQQPKMVPESDLLAVKRRASEEEKKRKSYESRISELEAQLEESRLKVPEDAPETTKALQKTLLEERKRMQEKIKATDEAEVDLAKRKLEVKKAEIAKEHGVPVEVVDSAESEMEAENLALKHKITSPEEGKKENPQTGRTDYDSGTRGGAPSAPKMTALQLIAEGLRRGELEKKR